MTKILKKSLACLLVFVLCFTAIAGCLSVSAAAPAATFDYKTYFPNDDKVWAACAGQNVRAQLSMENLEAGATIGVSVEIPEGAEITSVDGWSVNTSCALSEVSSYFDEENSIFTIIYDVTVSGNYTLFVRYNITEEVAKKVHYMDAKFEAAFASDDEIKQITVTDYYEVFDHNVVTDEAVAPGCETTGLTEGSHCSICGEVFVAQEEVAALGHAWDEGVVDPDATCTDEGVITYTCANDPSHTKTEAISAKGHTEVAYEEVAATCTTVGYTGGTYCSVCDAVITPRTEVPALGHDYGEPVDNGNGTHTATCANDANHTITEDHEYVDGTCACGAVEEVVDPLENANIVFNTLSVKVGETIGLNIRVNKAASVNLYNKNYIVKVAVTTTGFDGTTFMQKESTTKYATLTKTTSSRFELEYTGIGMYEFTCPIDCVIEIYDVEGGTLIARSPKNTITVADKLAATLSQVEAAIPTTADETQKANYIKQATMLSDLLNMGAAAQELFASENYYPNSDLADTEKFPLANAGLTLNYASADLDLSTLNRENTVVVEDAYKHSSFANQTSCSIKLNPGPNFKYRYLNGISTTSKLSMEVTYVNSVKTASDPNYQSLYDLSESVSVSGRNTTCYFSNIAFYDAGQTVTVRLYEGDGKNLVLTHTYSMESYIYDKISDTVSPQALKDFCSAFGKFGKSANAFF